MKRQTVRIYTQEARLLWEAMRRTLHVQTETPSTWVGLGCWTTYKAGVESGLFKPTRTRPRPYGNSWFKLTPLGQRIVNQLVRKKLCPRHIHEMYQTDIRIPKEVTVCVPEV